MPLFHPRSEIPFAPSPRYILGPFDVYDREETRGRLLDQYDPNDARQLEQLLDLYFFTVYTEAHGYTLEHRSALTASVQRALADPKFDFASLLEVADDSDYFFLPSSWTFNNPRQFFVLAYTLLLKRWGEEFRQHGIYYSPSSDL